MSIKNVAVVGASGNVGAPLVEALLDAHFNVTAVTRESSAASFPSGVTVRRADLASAASLAAALRGQDAVVSAVSTAAAFGGAQLPLLDAAVAAGVRRIIPSDFGTNTRELDPASPAYDLFAGKRDALRHLAEKTEGTGTTWTGIATGLFFDYALEVLLGVSLADKTMTIYDSGNEPFSPSTVPLVVKAIVAVLLHPDETANRYIDVASFTITQNELHRALEEESGFAWAVERVSAAEVGKRGEERVAAGDFNGFNDVLKLTHYRDGKGNVVPEERLANKLLGIGSEDLNTVVRDILKGKGLAKP